MSKGQRARVEGPSWRGIPRHDAPVTFGAHVTRVTISVSEQTECGQVVRTIRSRQVVIWLPGFRLGGIVSGCVLALRALLIVVQYTIKASDHPVDASGCVQVSVWEWGGLFKK